MVHHGGGYIPADGDMHVFLYALAIGIQVAQCEVGVGMAAQCCFQPPEQRGFIIDAQAITVMEHPADIVLGKGVSTISQRLPDAIGDRVVASLHGLNGLAVKLLG
jgi:hypothetical protein